MAVPGNDFINQAIDEVVTVLTTSPLFTHPDVLPGATGTVRVVDRNVPESDKILNHRLPHATVLYSGHEPADDGTVESTDYHVDLAVLIYHRGSDRMAVWSAVQKAAAAVTAIVEQQNSAGQFGEFAYLARDRGAKAIDTQEESGFGALIQAGITLTIQHPTPTY